MSIHGILVGNLRLNHVILKSYFLVNFFNAKEINIYIYKLIN